MCSINKQIEAKYTRNQPVPGSLRISWTHRSHLCQVVPGLKQVGQGKQSDDLGRVLHQTPVAGLEETELALDHPERVFHLGADACLGVLELLQNSAQRRVGKGLAFARLQATCQAASRPLFSSRFSTP